MTLCTNTLKAAGKTSSKRHWHRPWSELSLAFAMLVACSSGGSAQATCVPGASAACACAGGASGVQTCRATGVFDACSCAGGGSPGASNEANGTDGGGGGKTTTEESSGPGGPRFLSFGVSANELTEGESVTVSAVLTDPDGIDDLIGGTLTSADGAAQYGAFATSGQEGAYAATLSWAQVNSAKALTFNGTEEREFKATFYDVAGHSVSRTVKITFHCPPEKAAIAGICAGVKMSTSPKSCIEVCGTLDCAPNVCPGFLKGGLVNHGTAQDPISCSIVPGQLDFDRIFCCCR